MAFGEIIYNITNMYVAKLNSDNTFGTPSRVDQLQKLSYNFVGDTDMIKSYGLVTDLLAIDTHMEGTFSQASVDFGTLGIMSPNTAGAPSGTTPNQIVTMDFKVGGAGLPYFAFVVEYAAQNGARFVAGAAKCMLDNTPGFEGDQNKFLIREVGIKMVAPSTSARLILRTRRLEGTYTLPTDAAGFGTYFSGFFA